MKKATAGRHKGLSTVYIKHNLFHQSRLGRDIELQNTHIVLFKSPRDVVQINTLSQQLGLGCQLKDWYTTATSVPYAQLLIDLIPKKVDSLRYCTNSGSTPSLFFLPQSRQQITFFNDEHTTSLYSDRVPEIFSELQNNFLKNCPKDFIQFLNECIVNLLRAELIEIQEQEILKFREEIHLLILKRTSLSKRREILSSKKRDLISILTPSIINRLS